MRRLLFTEAEKLIFSTVFWVAPISLAFFLGLMLFGFEVHAAKNGIVRGSALHISGAASTAVTVDNRYTGSLVVSSYSGIAHMFGNIVGLAMSPLGGKESKRNISRDPAVQPGEVGEFNYLGTIFKNLIDPKPLPRKNCDCVEKEDRKSSLELFSFFISPAYAANSVYRKDLPRIEPEDSFIERLDKRLKWLTEPVDLGSMLIDRSRFNGMRFTYISLYFAFVFMLPIITISVVSNMFAGEFSHGTIRTCLLRSVKRSDLLKAKFAVLATYLCLLTLFFVIVTLTVGVIFAGYGNLVLDSKLIGNVESSVLILGDGALLLFLSSIPVITISLFPLGTLGILISYLRPEPSTVIGTTTIIYFILFALGGLPFFEDIKFLFFTTYMDAWTLLFQNPFPASSFISKIVVMLLISAGIMIAVDYISTRKDIYV